MNIDKIMKISYDYYHNMQKVVSITSQGQLTIPQKMRDYFGIKGAVKAIIEKKDNVFIVKPQKSFWSLSGSLKSDINLTDEQLREARNEFSKSWSKNG
jgi:bifunctional DNA-binding transcriptional regulator/antitoxin component of YhaV-PrlF toxin-antitoxin module